MILSVVRHARSFPEDDTVNDSQRQVKPKAAKKFKRVLKQYRKAGEMDPDVIFCGPETRNMQSAEIARDQFGLDPDQVVQIPDLSPTGDPKKAWAAIKQWVSDQGAAGADCEVLAIGSNPALAGLSVLVHGLGTKAGESGAIKLKKGSVAKYKVYDPNSAKSSSELRSYLPPGLASM